MEICDFGIVLRLVDIQDAEFILKLRNNKVKSKYINSTPNDLSLQVEWLNKYKEREKLKQEYYFIALDEDKERFATYRIYNINSESVEIGSWISAPELKKPINSIKVDFLVKKFVFEILGYTKLKFEVRRENRSVINYHKKYNPKIIKEDELNIYFVLTRINFQQNKDKFERLF